MDGKREKLSSSIDGSVSSINNGEDASITVYFPKKFANIIYLSSLFYLIA